MCGTSDSCILATGCGLPARTGQDSTGKTAAD